MLAWTIYQLAGRCCQPCDVHAQLFVGKKISDFAWSFMQSALLIGSPFVNTARGSQPPRTALLLTGGSALKEMDVFMQQRQR